MPQRALIRKALLGKLILTLVAASLCAAPANAGGPLQLRICTTGDYKPLTYLDPATGRYSGIDIDMAADLASHLGREPTFVATSWQTLMADVAADKCDIAMGGISVTAERAAVADFTDAYLSNGKTPLVAAVNAGRFDSVTRSISRESESSRTAAEPTSDSPERTSRTPRSRSGPTTRRSCINSEPAQWT